jgi:hypothetical protein
MKTIPLSARGGKVTTDHFAVPHEKGAGLQSFLDKLPRTLAADHLRQVVSAIRSARDKGKPVLWGMGGHVIKCGLAPIFLDLMRRGYATGFLMNGSTAIHDFEIGVSGATSEDVEAVLPDGRFGSAEETGRYMNEAIIAGLAEGIGMGEAIGRCLADKADARFAAQCLQLGAWQAGVPVTVHVAVGTDTPHTHPAANGAAIGQATHTDFRLCCSMVAELNDGGVYLNCGSAVLLPEVFLKAVSVMRNLGHPLQRFTTVNMDFLQHYRPSMNVVRRPHAKSDGLGVALTGHHEIMLPLLAALLVEGDA